MATALLSSLLNRLTHRSLLSAGALLGTLALSATSLPAQSGYRESRSRAPSTYRAQSEDNYPRSILGGGSQYRDDSQYRGERDRYQGNTTRRGGRDFGGNRDRAPSREFDRGLDHESGYGPDSQYDRNWQDQRDSGYDQRPSRRNPSRTLPANREQLDRGYGADDAFDLEGRRGGGRSILDGSWQDGPDFNRQPTRSIPQRTQPRTPVDNSPEDIQQHISRHYQTQGTGTLLALPPQSALSLYAEVLEMIEQRHIEPPTIQKRVERGLLNLTHAVQNPAFLQTSRASFDAARVQAYNQALRQIVAQVPLRTNNDAVTLASQTAQMSQRDFGLSPTAVILEFVFGAAESLDKYSAFVPPERAPGASLQMEESIVGIGVQVEAHDRGVEVKKVIQGGPASEAGLQAGDVLVAVSGQPLTGMELDQTVELITGPAGSTVVLNVERGERSAFSVSVPRRTVAIHSVNDVQMLGGNARVGYFKLDKFAASSASEMDAALWSLHQQGMQSLIVDLRGNPGGLLTAAIELSDKFLPQGTIVSTRGRTSADNTQEVAKQPNTWKTPLVVLIDEGSASASEIFAAAIQENRRGTIVGRTSYGKGTVQTQFPLRTAGASLRITTAKFYAPSGREMAGVGVEPDVAVNLSQRNGGMNLQSDPDIQAALEVAQGSIGLNQNLTSTNPVRQPWSN